MFECGVNRLPEYVRGVFGLGYVSSHGLHMINEMLDNDQLQFHVEGSKIDLYCTSNINVPLLAPPPTIEGIRFPS